MKRYEHIKNHADYQLLLKTGMFWEFYPELTGNWQDDKFTIRRKIEQEDVMTEKVLGKITSARFGLGGYEGCQFGLHLDMEGNGTGCSTYECAWDYNMIKWNDGCKWTQESRDQEMAKIVRKVSDLLHDAKVESVDQLVGKPVEMTFENMRLVSYRILTEVL